MIFWKTRMNHMRDYRNCMLKMLNIPIPKDDPEGGLIMPKVLRGIPPYFNGKVFWPMFEELGHTSCKFEECTCIRK